MWGQLEEGSPGFRVPPAEDSGRVWGSGTRSSRRAFEAGSGGCCGTSRTPFPQTHPPETPHV